MAMTPGAVRSDAGPEGNPALRRPGPGVWLLLAAALATAVTTAMAWGYFAPYTSVTLGQVFVVAAGLGMGHFAIPAGGPAEEPA
jgi:hypothetical protein